MTSQYSLQTNNAHTLINNVKIKESWKNTSNKRLLRSRLYLELQILEELCIEKLSFFPAAKELLNNIMRIQLLLKREPRLTIEQLENLMEHCKTYIYKRLNP